MSRGIFAHVLLTLLLLVLCLNFLPVAHAKYDMSLFRTYFGCPKCDESRCKVPVGCEELVKEPGVCGCCLTCARQEGELCGIHEEKCGRDLVCNPPENAINGFEALMQGRGICQGAPAFRPSVLKPVQRSPWSMLRQGAV